MALISMRQLLDHAAEHEYSVPAFNINNMEQIHAIMQAADACNSPVILQGSAGARKYAGEPFLRHMVEAAVETWPHIPIVLHQDHGASPAVCLRSLRSGFTSVMMNGSLHEDMKTPAPLDYNIAVTRAVVDMAHAVGASVEGEIGVLGSLESGTAAKEDGSGAEGKLSRDRLLTDPEQTAEFVRSTGVDALAIAIGTSHGAYKFSRRPTGDILAIDRIREIHARVPNTHLVMHGSSSVPQEWLKVIRQYGGRIKETYGVPVEEIREGIRHGVRKVNIDTDIRLVMTGAMRRLMAISRRTSLIHASSWPRPRRKPRSFAGSGSRRLGRQGMPTVSNRYHWSAWPNATPQASSVSSCTEPHLAVVRHQRFKRHIQPLPAAKEGQLDQRGGSRDDRVDLAQQVDPRGHCSACGEQIIHDDHALTWFDCIGLDLDSVGAVFQRVLVSDGFAGQFPGFAQHDEPASELERQRGCYQEASALDPGEQIRLIFAHGVCHPSHRYLPGVGIPEQGRDVVEKDPGFGEIGDSADVLFQVHAACVSTTAAPGKPLRRTV
jgi:fructose-bisphosphate aldolase, class II